MSKLFRSDKPTREPWDDDKQSALIVLSYFVFFGLLGLGVLASIIIVNFVD